MCLLIFSYHHHPEYRLILAANRDEFYDRPTDPLSYWNDAPDVLAGRDLKGMGTWLGITKTCRIAAITNFRGPAPADPNAPSRGLLVSDYLKGTETAKTYLKHIKTIGYRYNGFNLLIGDRNGLYYYSNKTEKIKELKPGLYGLSNHLLDTPWPKVKKGKEDLKKLVAGEKPINAEDIFSLLADRTFSPDSRLPDTGIDLNWERILSTAFITSDIYGTRSSSLILIDINHEASFTERSFIPQKTGSLKQKTRKFSLKLSDTV